MELLVKRLFVGLLKVLLKSFENRCRVCINATSQGYFFFILIRQSQQNNIFAKTHRYSQQKILNFPIGVSSVNVTKSAGNFEFALREKCPDTDQKKLRIWTLFTQCWSHLLKKSLTESFVLCAICVILKFTSQQIIIPRIYLKNKYQTLISFIIMNFCLYSAT